MSRFTSSTVIVASVERSQLMGTKPFSYMNLNLSPPFGKRPSLLTVDDMSSVFYEVCLVKEPVCQPSSMMLLYVKCRLLITGHIYIIGSTGSVSDGLFSSSPIAYSAFWITLSSQRIVVIILEIITESSLISLSSLRPFNYSLDHCYHR